MSGDDDLSAYGLARCRRCRRILLLAHLEHGRCRAGIDCGAFEAMAKAWDEAPPQSCPLFARNVEVALLCSDGWSAGGDGLSDGAKAVVESFALMV